MRILLVEDHRDTATVLARLLRNEGHDVGVAATARDALAACERRNGDLLICEIDLPGHDGWVVLETPAGDDPIASAERNLAFTRRWLAV